MNLDIRTEHIDMRPEWHRLIDAWVERCQRYHPSVAGLDIKVRQRDDRRRPGAEVEAVASTGRRRLRAATKAPLVRVALHDVLGALEDELLVHEAVSRAA